MITEKSEAEHRQGLWKSRQQGEDEVCVCICDMFTDVLTMTSPLIEGPLEDRHRELVDRSLAKESETLYPILQTLFKCPRTSSSRAGGGGNRKRLRDKKLWESYYCLMFLSCCGFCQPTTSQWASKYERFDNGNLSKWHRGSLKGPLLAKSETVWALPQVVVVLYY